MDEKRILSTQEAAIYLGISKSLLYKLTSTRQIAHYRPNNGKLWFKISDLDDYALQNRIPTIQETQLNARVMLNTRQKK